VRGDLCQGQVGPCLQELPGPFDAAQDHVLVRRQTGSPLELPGEVVGAEVGGRRQLLQGQAGLEVLLDVLEDGAPLRRSKPARSARTGWGRTRLRRKGPCRPRWGSPACVPIWNAGSGCPSAGSEGACGNRTGAYRNAARLGLAPDQWLYVVAGTGEAVVNGDPAQGWRVPAPGLRPAQ
jgi:hypothetical protein